MTVTDDDGINYREIAETLTEMGFSMNHSSVHNHVVKIMQKFATEIMKQWDVEATPERVLSTAKSPLFQSNIAELLQVIEANRINA